MNCEEKERRRAIEYKNCITERINRCALPDGTVLLVKFRRNWNGTAPQVVSAFKIPANYSYFYEADEKRQKQDGDKTFFGICHGPMSPFQK